MDWNDLRLALAVARAGNLAGAAKALGLDHSTVFRRLGGIESRLGVRLFERLPGGLYRPSEAGERVALAAERMEQEAVALARDVIGRDARLSGRLRVTSSETLAHRLLPRGVAALRAAHPGIVVELAIENRILSLSRREADIALRPVRPRESELWGRKLADIAWAIYGAPVVPRPTSLAALGEHPVIGWDEAASGIAAARWLSESVPDEAVAFRSTSLLNQLAAARAGIGLAVLPCYLGDGDPDVVRALPDPVPALAAELWIVTHRDLKATARVRAFFDIVGGALAAERALLAGLAPRRRDG